VLWSTGRPEKPGIRNPGQGGNREVKLPDLTVAGSAARIRYRELLGQVSWKFILDG